MEKRLIGYATTDSNGIAVLNYIGQGLGELNISAETGGEVAFADDGHTGSLSSKWSQWTTYPSTVTRGTEYTTITKNSSNTLGYHILDLRNLSFEVIEFDIFVDSSVNNNIILQFRNESRTVNRQLALSNWSIGTDHLNEWIHFKCDFNTNKISNSVNSTTVGLNFQDSTRLYFAVQVAQNSLRYRNLFLYKGSTQLTSEPYTLLDCQFYQKGTSEPPTNTWSMNGFTPSYSSNGTTLTSTTFATCFANLVGTGLNVYDWNSPVAIEFDVVSFSSTNADFQIYDETNNVSKSFSALSISNGSHIKILVEANQIRYFVDGTERTGAKWTGAIGTFRCGLRATGTITFKEFKIYPI